MTQIRAVIDKLFGIKTGPEKMRERSAGAFGKKVKALTDTIEWAIESAADDGHYEYTEIHRLNSSCVYTLPCVMELKKRGYVVKMNVDDGYVISWKENDGK